MPKSENEKFQDYMANRDHYVGSEAWLTEAELATKRRIEEMADPNHPSNSAEAKAARKRKVDELFGKPIKSYKNMRG